MSLINYHKQRDPASGEVTLLSPINSEYGHDAFFGWELQSGSDTATIAGADTAWSAPEGARLTPQTPVTLTLNGANGVSVERTISVDEHYMFTITDVVRNAGGATISVRPFGVVRRQGMPENYRNNPIVHQGLIGVFGEQYEHVTFSNADKHAREKRAAAPARTNGLKSARAKAAGSASPSIIGSRPWCPIRPSAIRRFTTRARKTIATIIAPPIAANGARPQRAVKSPTRSVSMRAQRGGAAASL
ncbi:MAG: membrane protein insertase YidC [Terricaulis sp.]|nr:membrane protein insertase YidC [Terricaulis sp.]